jgi:threonine dehydrogenase-like Zn-dependent dehydrogenase
MQQTVESATMLGTAQPPRPNAARLLCFRRATMAHASAARVSGIAVYPGRPNSIHLTSQPAPIHGPDDVLIRIRRAGICGTDKEIIDAKLGAPPPGSDELVIGHEAIGIVEAVGDRVTTIKQGDFVVATVRRPDGCPACQAGQPDMCLWRKYHERGIFFAHGFMVEQIVEHPDYLIVVPPELEPVGVLLEPTSVVEKALRQARLIQRRIDGWQPKTAVVVGAGPIGLLGMMLLRAEGFDVYTLARSPAPTAASRLVAACGAHYISTKEISIAELTSSLPNVDVIIEASGASQPVAESMQLLGNNGVLVLLSITGGDFDHDVPIDLINREFVLGNKVMVGSVNSALEDFTSGVTHLAQFEELWPGLTGSLITQRLPAFENPQIIRDASVGGIKAVLEFDGV